MVKMQDQGEVKARSKQGGRWPLMEFHSLCWGQNIFFWSNSHFFNPKNFWTQKYFGPNLFYLQFSCTEKFYAQKNYKIFLIPDKIGNKTKVESVQPEKILD